MKKCCTCKKEKEITSFCRDKSNSDGYRYRCKECTKQANKKYYTEKTTLFKERSTRWRKENPKKAKEHRKKWNKENVEACKEQVIKWRKENPERHKELLKRWKEQNPEKYKEQYTRVTHLRRARKANNGPIDKDISIGALYERDKGVCGICKELVSTKPSIDHIKPISKGGTHIWDNIQLTHLKCNIRKGNKYG